MWGEKHSCFCHVAFLEIYRGWQERLVQRTEGKSVDWGEVGWSSNRTVDCRQGVGRSIGRTLRRQSLGGPNRVVEDRRARCIASRRTDLPSCSTVTHQIERETGTALAQARNSRRVNYIAELEYLSSRWVRWSLESWFSACSLGWHSS